MSRLFIPQALKIFTHDLRWRNYSEQTIKHYSFCITKFHGYLKKTHQHKEVSEITLTDLIEYHKTLQTHIQESGRPYSQKTLECCIKSLVQLFKFLKRHSLILLDPSEGLPPMRRENSIPRIIMTASEVETLLSQPNTNTLYGYRDRTIMEILYSTGLRRQEIVNLTIYDINMATGFVRVNDGKGKKDRIVPIGKIAVKYAKEYLETVRPNILKGRTCDKLFICQGGKPLEPDHLNRIISRHVKQAKLTKQINCHTFRHTCATAMLRGGSSLKYVQEMLGHASIESTEIYTRVVPIDLKKTHKKTHPAEQQKNKKIIPFKNSRLPVYYKKQQ